MPHSPKLFQYTRWGQLELARYEDRLHLAVIQLDGTAATHWLTPEEATDLGGRLLRVAADAVATQEHDHDS